MHQVFGADIARGAGGKRAAAQATQRSIEPQDARLPRRQGVGQPHAPGVVEMQRERHAGKTLQHLAAQRTDLGGVGHAGGIAQRDAFHA